MEYEKEDTPTVIPLLPLETIVPMIDQDKIDRI